jgi:murein DD-endopeptidase MepM/ murein hydrolase activator NlpD
VRIQHLDGRVTVYAHMKKDSPVWPQSLVCGAEIGKVGMSGSTNAPHVHFDVWNNTGGSVRIDPYSGPCDSGSSDWNQQIGQYPDGYVSFSCTPTCGTSCSAR